ncbi:MAG: hypothetical protein AAB214_02485 [Fibrobacterota bacterium]
MTKTFLLLAASGSIAIAAVPVQFTAGSAAKADEVNKNFGYLDSAKATKASVDLLTSAMVAKIDASEANTKLGAKVDTGVYNKYVREQATKSVADTSSKRRIDSLAVATKTADTTLARRVATVEGKVAAPTSVDWSGITGKPAMITNDLAGIKDWTDKNFAGAFPVAGIKSTGTSDYGGVAFMRRDIANGATSVIDVHTDGVINSWGTSGGIQTNSVTRIDGNGNGSLATLKVGATTESKTGSALSVQASNPTGEGWNEGIEILPEPKAGWGLLAFRSPENPGLLDGSTALARHPKGGFLVAINGLKGMIGTEGEGWAFRILPTGQAYLGSDLTVGGILSAAKIASVNISATDLRVTGSLKTAPTEPWADYVFEPGYKAMALKDVETFAKANGHLPEVPSAAEVAKDGIDLAKMNAILLKKIEELTLHAVAQEKKMEALSAKVEALQAERK